MLSTVRDSPPLALSNLLEAPNCPQLVPVSTGLGSRRGQAALSGWFVGSRGSRAGSANFPRLLGLHLHPPSLPARCQSSPLKCLFLKGFRRNQESRPLGLL